MNELQEQQIEQLKRDKAKLLTKIGQSIYYEYRVGNIYSDELNEYAEQIKKIDKTIYDLLKNEQQDLAFLRCECGNVFGEEDVFCGKCGKEVVRQTHYIQHCQSCQIELVMNSKFCHVCGTRQKSE